MLLNTNEKVVSLLQLTTKRERIGGLEPPLAESNCLWPVRNTTTC